MSTEKRTNSASTLTSAKRNTLSKKKGNKKRSEWLYSKKRERKWRSAVSHLNCTKNDLMSEIKIQSQEEWKLMPKRILFKIMNIKAARELMRRLRMMNSIKFEMLILSLLIKKDSFNKRGSKSKLQSRNRSKKRNRKEFQKLTKNLGYCFSKDKTGLSKRNWSKKWKDWSMMTNTSQWLLDWRSQQQVWQELTEIRAKIDNNFLSMNNVLLKTKHQVRPNSNLN